MRTIGGRLGARSAAALAAGILAIGVAGPVAANHVIVSAGVPSTPQVGALVYIPVALRSGDEAPLPGTTVTFFLDASFANVAGEVEVGRAVTRADGTATLAYKPRISGHHEIQMQYLLPGESDPELATLSVDVARGGQLYADPPGLQIPGLNVGLLMAILTTVWTILFGIALVLVRIARAGTEPVAGIRRPPA